MDNDRLTRKLTAVLYADVAGYSRLTGEDEEGTHRRLSVHLDRFAHAIAEHDGRVVHYAGDAVLADFETVSDALACALSVQTDLRADNETLPTESRVEFRIGINLGEVIVDRNDIYGDGVNVAARLESLAEPGGICVSEAVRAAAGRKLPIAYEFLGEREVKNIVEPVRAYRVVPQMAEDESAGPPSCPFPGMVPFQPEDAAHFHGREDEIGRMVGLLRHQRFMMVIGPSGSGKSSLVHAGLLPELAASRYFEDGYWLVCGMRPGPEPSTRLARALETEPWADALDLEVADRLLAKHAPAKRVLLLIDQFEETFTQATREESGSFISALQGLRTRDNVVLVLTLRADFYPELMNSYLWPVDASQRIEVAPLRGEALREAIVRPAEDVGVRIEQELLNRLLTDASDEPGVLPLLQETMRLLWHELEGRLLPFAAYERLSRDSAAHAGNSSRSGLAAAIAMRADATLAELGEREQAIARRTFLRLMQFGEGRADTRRQQPLTALRTADDDDRFIRTLEHLTDHRLLTRAGGDEPESATVDIAHESLITSWSRLRRWADERREAEQVRRRLEAKAAEWVRLGRGVGGLLDETALPEAQRWLAGPDAVDLGHGADLPALVEASGAALKAAAREREETRQRELTQAKALAEEQHQRAEEQSRASARLRRLAGVLAGVFVVALVAAAFAWLQGQTAQRLAEQEAAAREEAEEQRVESERARTHAERLRAQSIAQLLLTLAPQQLAIGQHERSALMARQAYLLSGDATGRLKDHANRVLRSIITSPGFAPRLTTDVLAVAFSPDGRMLAASSFAGKKEGQLLLWNLERRGAPPTALPAPSDDYFYTLSFTPDSKSLAAARGEDGAVLLWDLEQPSEQPVVLGGHAAGAWSLAFSPDGRRLAVGTRRDDTVQLLDVSGVDAGQEFGTAETPVHDAVPEDKLNAGGAPVAFSQDGATLASGTHGGRVRLWDPGAPTEPVLEYRGHEGPVWSLAFSPDGHRLASGGKDATVRVWDLRDADARPRILRGHADGITSLAFGPDGDTLITSSLDNSIRRWDLRRPDSPAIVVRNAPGDVYDVAFAPDDLLLASGTASSEGLQVWDLRPSGQPSALPGDGTPVAVAFSPDGKLLSASGGEVISLWNLSDRTAPPNVLPGHGGNTWGVAFSPDGKLMSSTSRDGTVKLWRLGNPVEAIATLGKGKVSSPWSAPFSPDGKSLATFKWDEMTENMFLRLWDLGDLGAEPASLRTEMTRWINDITFSRDGSRLAASGREGIIHLEDLENPGAGAHSLRGHEGMAWSVAFSPDGTRLASGGRDATVRLWDPADPRAPSSELGRHDDEVLRVRFSPNGEYLASSSKDRTVRLWNLANPGTPPALLHGHEGAVWALAFSPDGKTLVSGAKGQLLFWDLTHPVTAAPLDRLAELVCDKVWRNLTLEEWHQFVGEDIPYERTCPDLPAHPSVAAGK